MMSLSDELYRRMTKVSDQTIYENIWHLEAFTYMSILEFIPDRWHELKRDLSKAVQGEDGRLFVHRCITVENVDSFVKPLSRGRLPGPYKGLGVHWTWSYDSAQCYWGDLDHKDNVVLTGTVDLEDINIKETVLANFHPDVGRQEKEIRLKKGTKIRLTDLSRDDTWHIKRFDPPLEFPA